MKARIVGERQSDVVPAPVPEPKEDWAVVKVHASAMCTEYKTWLAGDRREVIGHEGAGEVVAVAQPGRVKVGRPGYGDAAISVWQLRFVPIW